jgi:hypothetical protein
MKSRLVALHSGKEEREGILRSPGSRLAALVVAIAVGSSAVELCELALGQVPQTLNGPPVQVQPYVPEPGVPLITINPGTVNPFSGLDGAGAGDQTDGSGSGTGDGTSAGSGTSADATGGDFSSGGGWWGARRLLVQCSPSLGAPQRSAMRRPWG